MKRNSANNTLMINIHIENTVPDAIPALDIAELEKIARFVLTSENFTNGSLSLVIIGDEDITQLKRDYFDMDTTTDVVSFDLSDDDCPDDTIDAEIAVNAELASREAPQRGNEPAAELFLYVVHGILHQAGYDDHDPDEYKQMHKRENELMTQLGYGEAFGTLED